MISLVRDRENNQVLAYIDGELAGTVGAGSVAFHDAELTNPLYFGTDLRKNYFLNGEISEVRMWSDERTAEEIADYADKTVTGSEDGLAHAWLFSEPEDLGPNTIFSDLIKTGGIAVKAEGFAQRTTDPEPELRISSSKIYPISAEVIFSGAISAFEELNSCSTTKRTPPRTMHCQILHF